MTWKYSIQIFKKKKLLLLSVTMSSQSFGFHLASQKNITMDYNRESIQNITAGMAKAPDDPNGTYIIT